MPVPDALARTPAIAGPLGSLALSQLRPAAPTLALRALRWHEGLTRLGLIVPFYLVHDVGMVFAADGTLLRRIEPQVDALFRSVERSFDVATLAALQATRLFVVTLADSLDTDTLHLFGMLGAGGNGDMSLVDLLAAFASPEANDIVNFS